MPVISFSFFPITEFSAISRYGENFYGLLLSLDLRLMWSSPSIFEICLRPKVVTNLSFFLIRPSSKFMRCSVSHCIGAVTGLDIPWSFWSHLVGKYGGIFFWKGNMTTFLSLPSDLVVELMEV